MKRIVLILAVALALSLFSAGVLAEEQTAPGAVTHEQIPFQVNPLYEGLVDPADFAVEPEEEPEGEDELSHSQSAFNGTKATYVSAEKAAKQLREQMKKRTERVELYIYNKTSNYKALMTDVMMQATAHTGDPEEGDYLLWHYAGWSGEVYSDLVNERYQFHFILDIEYYTSAEQEKALDTAVKELINSLNLKGKSDYEKVCAVYDYICQNITYDYANLNDGSYTLKYSAYAALINKTAVCQGYSNLLYRLLLELGIDNRIITGETLEGPHAWNIIKLGDVYYNADATWDAVPGEHVYFLKNSEGFGDHVRYLDYMTTQFHRDYPMSATDYVDGVAGEPEHIFVWGICGEDAYWTIDRDGVLTIFGTGATDSYLQNTRPGPWSEWTDGFDKVVIEEGITKIGSFTFYKQDNIVSVQLPESLTQIEHYAFRDCKALTHIRIPGSVKELQSGMFQYCNGLESVELEEGLERICHGAFDGCTSLKSVKIPETVTDISSTAFDRCQSLTEITIPVSVEHLYGFRGCTGLETVHIYGAKVGTWAFQYCTSLKNVVLYDTVDRVSTNAFDGCTALETITVPASVTYFGMEGCSGLKTIYFQGNAPEMPYHAFRGTTATAYYPADNSTWTEDIMQNYEGNITWVSYTPGEPVGLLGDVSGDGILDSYDATLILQYDVGMITAETIRLDLADVSGDGIVDSYDATLILQYDVGMIAQFPAAA